MELGEVIAKAEAGGYDQPSDSSEPTEPSQGGGDQGGAESAPEVPADAKGRDASGKFVKSDSAKTGTPSAPPVPGSATGSAPAAPPAVGSKDVPASEQPAVQAAKVEIDPDDETTWKPEHHIPYDRFKTVNEKARAAEKRAAELERKLELAMAVREVLPQQKAQQRPEQDDVLEEFFGDQGDADPRYNKLASEVTRLSKALSEQQHTQQRKQVEQELEGRIGEVRARYPDVDEDDLWSAVALRGGKADLHGIAEAKQERINAYKAQGVKEYLASRGSAQPAAPSTPAKQAPAAPPRPAQSSPASASGALVKEGHNLMTEEGRRAYAAARFG